MDPYPAYTLLLQVPLAILSVVGLRAAPRGEHGNAWSRRSAGWFAITLVLIGLYAVGLVGIFINGWVAFMVFVPMVVVLALTPLTFTVAAVCLLVGRRRDDPRAVSAEREHDGQT